jgi:adenylosuccinate synthase
VSDLVRDSLSANRFVLFEFGQAYLLGKRTGFPPNVTASHTYTPEIFVSAGIPCSHVHNITVSKAYDTKVGTHVFVSEIPLDHPLSKKLRQIEFGTTTGRQRMVGWFDAVEKGHTLREGGFQDMVINKLDVLGHSGDWQGDLQICVAYQLPDGSITNKLPLNDAIRSKAIPVYESFQGWGEEENISGARYFNELPHAAKVYVAGMYYYTILAAYADRDRINEPDLPHVRSIGVGHQPLNIVKDVPEPAVLLDFYYQAKGKR